MRLGEEAFLKNTSQAWRNLIPYMAGELVEDYGNQNYYYLGCTCFTGKQNHPKSSVQGASAYNLCL